MIVAETVKEMRELSENARREGKSIGLVPTMGALHEGHLSLVKQARKETGFVVTSIFVNPTQFSAGEDYEKYPRDLRKDLKLLEDLADCVFAPSEKELYAKKQLSWIEVSELSKEFCGKFRPGHFRGVATVVAKLFNAVSPDKAFFGQKDFQQAAVIKKMVEDLNYGIDVVIMPTVREKDGLAMSSRNAYLTPEERRVAPTIYCALKEVGEKISGGEKNVEAIKSLVEKKILGEKLFTKIDYVEVADVESLKLLKEAKGRVVIAVAAWLGKTRLIDNTIVDAKC